jgi:hypothetical protein
MSDATFYIGAFFGAIMAFTTAGVIVVWIYDRAERWWNK